MLSATTHLSPDKICQNTISWCLFISGTFCACVTKAILLLITGAFFCSVQQRAFFITNVRHVGVFYTSGVEVWNILPCTFFTFQFITLVERHRYLNIKRLLAIFLEVTKRTKKKRKKKKRGERERERERERESYTVRSFNIKLFCCCCCCCFVKYSEKFGRAVEKAGEWILQTPVSTNVRIDFFAFFGPS